MAIAGARSRPDRRRRDRRAQANSPIRSVAQLKGKKIAVAQGSSADYHLLTVLNKAHLSAHDVTLDYLQPAEAWPR